MQELLSASYINHDTNCEEVVLPSCDHIHSVKFRSRGNSNCIAGNNEFLPSPDLEEYKFSNSDQAWEFTKEDKKKLDALIVPITKNEIERIKTLRQTNLLDSALSEEEYDRYTFLAARIFDVSA